MTSYILPAVVCVLSLVIGVHLTRIGASLIGTCLITFGIAAPLLTVLALNPLDETDRDTENRE